MRYVAVRNLERYQHYGNRRPTWVKLYLAVRYDEDFSSLTPTSRLLFIYSLLLAAERDNRIPADPSWLSIEVGMTRSAIAKSLDDLLAHEYLVPASKVASNGASGSASELASKSASPEKEEEKEEERTTTNPRDGGGRS